MYTFIFACLANGLETVLWPVRHSTSSNHTDPDSFLLERTGFTFRGSNSIFLLVPPYLIAPRSKFFLFESRLPCGKGLLSRDANGKSLKLFLFKQIGEKHGSVHNTA